MNAQRWSRLAVLLLLVIGAFALNPPALADGKVFSRAIAAVNVPDQEALIHYADGIETLVIETRFEAPAVGPAEGRPAAAGGVTEGQAAFAWVVPVPGPRAASGGSVPEVFATTSGVFPTLRAVCAPRVTHNVGEAFVVFTTIAVLILLAAVASGSAWMRVVVFVILLLVLAMVLLPSLGKASSSARGMSDGVEVFSREVIGSFDVAVIGAESAAAADDVQAWLAAEGFHVPAEAGSVMANYAAKGWVFIAAKLRADEGGAGGKLTPHPLAVRFRAASAVYPMRLTAVGNRELSLDLYVFGDRRAVVEGMDVVRSGPVLRGDPDAAQPYRWSAAGDGGEVIVGHRSLLSLTGTASTITKLSGVFTPAQMSQDLTIAWAEPRVMGDHKYSGHGASIMALNVTSAAWLAAVVCVFVIGAIRKTADRRLAGMGLAALAPCLLIGLGVRAALPTTPIEKPSRSAGRYYDRRSMVDGARLEIEKQGQASSIEELRNRIRAVVAQEAREEWAKDLVPPREEDSPMNYVVRESRHKDRLWAEVYWIDSRGMEEWIWQFELGDGATGNQAERPG